MHNYLVLFVHEFFDNTISMEFLYMFKHLIPVSLLKAITGLTLSIYITFIEFHGFIRARYEMSCISHLEVCELSAWTTFENLFCPCCPETITNPDILWEPWPGTILRFVYWRCLDFCLWLLIPNVVLFPVSHTLYFKWHYQSPCVFFCIIRLQYDSLFLMCW